MEMQLRFIFYCMIEIPQNFEISWFHVDFSELISSLLTKTLMLIETN